MKGTLKRLALMFVVLGLSLSTYARPADEKRVRKTDKVKQMTVESSRVKVVESENETRSRTGRIGSTVDMRFINLITTSRRSRRSVIRSDLDTGSRRRSTTLHAATRC